MPKTEARKAFLEYRRAVRENPLAEDEAIMRGYRELAKGTSLIRLSETITAGGTTTLEANVERWIDGQRRERLVDVEVPRLAIAWADATFTWTKGIQRDGSLHLQTEREPHHAAKRCHFRFEPGTFKPNEEREVDKPRWGRPARIRALVPTVPPQLRPPHALRGYHILWEAEWHLDMTVPPVDPALLKHIGGDLYAVVATWDLTPLEQAVLAGRVPEE